MLHLLASLVWLSPWWGLGLLAAAGLPILAHLLSRRRYRPVAFPAMRFVMAAASQAAAVDRPRHVLLLLLRMLALAAVVLGFMRPVWQPQRAIALTEESGQTVVILLDASASMQRISEGRSAFDQARSRAQDLIAGLEPGRDRAMVFVVTDQARPLLPEPTGNLTLLSERLDAAVPTWRADEPAVIAGALEAVVEHRPSRAVWMSDGQRASALPALLPIALEWILVGKPQANMAIARGDVSPYPPVAGQPVTVTVRARHFGDQPRSVTLLGESDAGRATTAATLLPGEDRALSLRFDQAPAEPGWITVRTREGDAFPTDDATGVYITPTDARRVMCFSASATGPDARRIEAMLAPTQSPDAADAAHRNRVTQHALDDLQQLVPRAEASAVLVLFGLDRPLSLDEREALVAHVDQGGGVVWIADSAASRQALGELPGPLRFEAEQAPASRVTQTRINFDHPALGVFEGPARAILADAVWPGVHQASLASGAQPLIASDTSPIVAVQSIGRGNLYAINADAFAASDDLTLSPAFVVLLNEIVRLAAPGPALPSTLRPGDALPTAWADRAFVTPNEAGRAPRDRAAMPGRYEAYADGDRIDGRWVELDPGESNLHVLGEPTESAGAAADGQAGVLSAATNEQPAQPLWPYALLAGLALFALEAFVLTGSAQGRAA